MRYHYISIGMAKMQNTDNTKCWLNFGATGTITFYWWKCKMVQPLWRKVCTSHKTKYTLIITLPGINSNELKTYV